MTYGGAFPHSRQIHSLTLERWVGAFVLDRDVVLDSSGSCLLRGGRDGRGRFAWPGGSLGSCEEMLRRVDCRLADMFSGGAMARAGRCCSIGLRRVVERGQGSPNA